MLSLPAERAWLSALQEIQQRPVEPTNVVQLHQERPALGQAWRSESRDISNSLQSHFFGLDIYELVGGSALLWGFNVAFSCQSTSGPSASLLPLASCFAVAAAGLLDVLHGASGLSSQQLLQAECPAVLGVAAPRRWQLPLQQRASNAQICNPPLQLLPVAHPVLSIPFCMNDGTARRELRA